MTSGGSVPRPVSLRTSSSQEGGARNTSWASDMDSPDLPGALEVDLQQHGLAVLRAAPSRPRGGVP